MQLPTTQQSGSAVRPRVTAAMVATRAGVSAATVSLVTSGKTAGRVSAENIAKVDAAVAELGYVVNGLGSSLAKGRSNIVFLVAPDVSNPFYAKVIAGVKEAIGKDFQLLLSVTEAGQTPKPQDVRRLLALRPAGLLIDAPSAEFLTELRASDPMVLLDAAGIESEVPSVNFDVAHGARMLAVHLAEQGHNTVCYLDSSTGTGTFRVRREAFCEEAQLRGIAVVATASTTVDVGTAALAFTSHWPAWSAQGVTALVCATDTQAYGILQEARVAGVAVPESLAVTGFDDLPYSETSNPGLTSVHLPAGEMGSLAGGELLKIISGEDTTGTHLTLEATLVIRGSTRATLHSD
ncbi:MULTISPECIES: LacI family DNA-binding transcriptional regulator [Arthrobacter]|uniref:LacI family DNA-binding transcriptional regulator n=1 Tax=unclassified Arthrobacter TaxID=235627 RepID=UPI0024BA9BE2|nr:LacI family DNA-binding transcriptional regulator [Arthrobacter sp. H35-MC1]MDJ0316718.1 LacI family DNA-binding transcriptional regulator [Arthrobacter sp. H35-MC1]